MKISAIDIGTNTALLLVAEVDNSGQITVLNHQQNFPRLGRSLNETGNIPANSIDNIISILNDFIYTSKRFQVDSIVIAATSAVRDANNRDEFIAQIKNKCGIAVNVLSGKDEAELTFRGAISGFDLQINDLIVLDIGGGSTEVIQSIGGAINGDSLQIGAVRLFEKYFKNSPLSLELTDEVCKQINLAFDLISYLPSNLKTLIGVAGTVTTLGCLDQNIAKFEVDNLKGYSLSFQSIEKWSRTLLYLHPDQILKLSDAAIGRSDILPAGVLILKEFMKRYGFKNILTSERGLRYGMVLNEWKKKISKQ
jgi:exopolyphosphatase / guanosine-5'-triphosphate,3'-diphosphate pyrophosphatase